MGIWRNGSRMSLKNSWTLTVRIGSSPIMPTNL